MGCAVRVRVRVRIRVRVRFRVRVRVRVKVRVRVSRLQLSNARGGALQRRGVVRRLRRGGLRLRGERALGN